MCETSEKRAEKALQLHLNDNNLIGSPDNTYLVDQKQVQLDTNILPRKACMKRKDYEQCLLEKKLQKRDKYIFSPKKSEKGIKLHKVIKESQEYRNIIVPGTYKQNSILEKIEDCGRLKKIDNVTLNGKPLEDYEIEER